MNFSTNDWEEKKKQAKRLEKSLDCSSTRSGGFKTLQLEHGTNDKQQVDCRNTACKIKQPTFLFYLGFAKLQIYGD